MAPTQKQMEQAKRVVERAVVTWKPLMGLAHWRIDCCYYRDYAEMPKQFRPKKGQWACQMWVEVHWEYLRATISVVLPQCTNTSDEILQECVRHELAHIVVNEMREIATHPWKQGVKHEERVVSTLAAAFAWTHNAGWNEGRAALRRKTAKKNKPKE